MNPPTIGTESFEAKDLCDKFLLSNKKFCFLKKKLIKLTEKLTLI